MQSQTPHRPVVLAIGGHDPSGGAGIQADIEAIGTNGCHATTALTCVTVQDSCNVAQVLPLPAETLKAQSLAVLQDCQVSAIKIGLLGSIPVAKAVASLLSAHPAIPVIFDPVLAAGGGSDLASKKLVSFIRMELLPLCDLITPNTHEVFRLSELGEEASADDRAYCLLQLGPQAVLLTGTHDISNPTEVINRFYLPNQPPISSTWPRLPGEYHGSGCTLASAIAARMALGEPIETAVQHALTFCWTSLKQGFQSGRCQSLPNRFYQCGF
jgi:hydroxymethylpyrimidine/phosphomethylpyrimidine kinase